MKFIPAEIPEVVIIEPKVFEDARGYFFESFNLNAFTEHIGDVRFVQDNESKSTYGTVRGLHYQLPPFNQQKLVRVTQGAVLDVAVDLRKSSPTFGQHVAVELSAENRRQLWVPRGFAHGFSVLTETAVFNYKVDNFYAPSHDRGVLWNDPAIGINWHIDLEKLQLSQKDAKQPLLAAIEEIEW